MYECGRRDTDGEDQALLRELSEALAEVRGAPPEALAAAECGLAWRTIDVELAELTCGSSADLGTQPAPRYSAGPQSMGTLTPRR